MFYLVCFDIVDDKDRRRVVKILKEYGCRVQKSVFECPGLSEKRFLKMRDRLEMVIDSLWDTVRFYRLCRGCLSEVEFIGIGEPPMNESTLVF
jgi:CRISPR-associated protein Cas2